MPRGEPLLLMPMLLPLLRVLLRVGCLGGGQRLLRPLLLRLPLPGLRGSFAAASAAA
jgi:hypothetical protein